MRRGTAILALVFLLAALVSVEARPLPTRSVRELTLHAETIVLAEPAAGAGDLTRFKVVEVMRGRGIRPGDTFLLDPAAHRDARV